MELAKLISDKEEVAVPEISLNSDDDDAVDGSRSQNSIGMSHKNGDCNAIL